MKKCLTAALFITLLAMMVLPSACSQPAKFQTGSLSVSPAEIVGGETSTVSIDVANIGGSKGTYTAFLKIDGIPVDNKQTTLAPGVKETLNFSVSKTLPGTYQITIDELAATLKVLRPAEFVLSDLTVNPAEPEVWQDVTVTAKVKNTGEISGTYNGTLKLDRATLTTKELSVPPGATETLTFSFKKDSGPGVSIEVGDLAKTITIKEGAVPTLKTGDKWVSGVTLDGIHYTMTLEVTGEEVVNGKSCYTLDGTLEPPLMGLISGVQMAVDKATMFQTRLQFSGETMGLPYVAEANYDFRFVTGGNLYPLVVGTEHRVEETESTTVTMLGQTQNETKTNIYIYKVVAIEDVTVPAGTFRCFKVVKYDEAGNKLSTLWMSDKVKLYNVKLEDDGTGEVDELTSYSIK